MIKSDQSDELFYCGIVGGERGWSIDCDFIYTTPFLDVLPHCLGFAGPT